MKFESKHEIRGKNKIKSWGNSNLLHETQNNKYEIFYLKYKIFNSIHKI